MILTSDQSCYMVRAPLIEMHAVSALPNYSFLMEKPCLGRRGTLRAAVLVMLLYVIRERLR